MMRPYAHLRIEGETIFNAECPSYRRLAKLLTTHMREIWRFCTRRAGDYFTNKPYGHLKVYIDLEIYGKEV